MNLRVFLWLLRRSLFSAFDDGCFAIAKGAAYSALLSFFPILTSAAALLVQARAGFAADLLEHTLQQIVPPGTEDLVMEQFRVNGARPVSLLIVAGCISVWAASGVIKSLIDGFHAAYRTPRNGGFWRHNSVGIALVLASGVPLFCASVLVVFGTDLERGVLRLISDPALHQLWWITRLAGRAARYVLASVTTVSVACTLYYFGPYRRQRMRYVWPGAVLASALWLLATMGFAWYVNHVARYNVMYGSLGAGIALLVWMYLISAIALYGCAFNAQYELLAGRKN